MPCISTIYDQWLLQTDFVVFSINSIIVCYRINLILNLQNKILVSELKLNRWRSYLKTSCIHSYIPIACTGFKKFNTVLHSILKLNEILILHNMQVYLCVVSSSYKITVRRTRTSIMFLQSFSDEFFQQTKIWSRS